MATGMFGANPDELRAVGGEFGVAAGLLESSGATVGAEIAGVRWLGVDATLYRANWGTTIPSHLSELSGVLETVNTDLERQAGDQEDASQPGNGNEGCAKSVGDGLRSAGNALGGFLKGVFVDGIWGDLKGLGALFGFDENGWSWDTMKNTWKGMGGLIGFDKDGNWSLDTLGNTWKEVGKDFLAWDQWKTDPAGALGKVAWNVGSLFIGVGEAKILAKAGTVADAGKVADVASDAGRVADAAGDAGRVADGAGDAADAARVADNAGDAADASKVGDNAPWGGDQAGAAPRSADEAGQISDEAAERASKWNQEDGYSPDVPNNGGRVDGADADKMAMHNGPYDTGARINPETGNLVSTSGREFAPENVSHHYTTTTGAGDRSLKVGSGPDGMPFQPNHHYVLDDGKHIVETNEHGVPVYDRHIVDNVSGQEGAPITNSDPFRRGGGAPTSASSDGWGGMNEGLVDPKRGHSDAASLRGANEDIAVRPQSDQANNYQALIENELQRAQQGKSAELPRQDYYVVERDTTVGNGGTGPATEYSFKITGADGTSYDELIATRKSEQFGISPGDGIDLTFQEHFHPGQQPEP
ncbi:hypothetical protein JRG19_07290 [Pseudoclavibacter alba]|uniref:WXG100 family type VII secretion target n=1 Tax=Pseudoclavibacter albus TaxID=272241 RepID=UPI0019D21E62|nr:hypothetical protein [Pseudoclavibacter alba]MBN6778348.1 hypothetical protein [Pseudoclavibacter alba]